VLKSLTKKSDTGRKSFTSVMTPNAKQQ